MDISKLPEEKNITEFSEKELLSWFKNYVQGWAKAGVGPPIHYEAIKTEIIRRNNERILNLTEKLHKLTIVLVVLTLILVFQTFILILKKI